MDELHQICRDLLRDANALAILLLDENHQALAGAGVVDRLSVPSLLTGDVLEKLAADGEYSRQYREGERTHLHLTLIQRALLIVFFDTSSSLGLVRLRVKKAAQELTRIFEGGPGSGGPPAAAAVIAAPRAGKG
jgi:hypothetical protein